MGTDGGGADFVDVRAVDSKAVGSDVPAVLGQLVYPLSAVCERIRGKFCPSSSKCS